MLLLALVVAAALRFWALGDIPPGLYRDEAANGLDAQAVLNGELDGQSPLYFSANNGREPFYVYLTTLPVLFLGNTTLAVRLAAAVVGTLTTLAAYKLAAVWFDRRIGLLTAWLWAITLWSIHLSRIGFRPILLPLMMSLTVWLATNAYRGRWPDKRNNWLWLLSGAVYGLSFYTYLPVRFTPLILLLFLIYLLLTNRGKPLWPGLSFAALGTIITLFPLAIVAFQQPELVLGRPGQVSIFNQAVNDGSPLGALANNLLATLAMFLVKGDTIVRHNPPGRPIFDLFLIIPFLIGLVWCVRNWWRPPAMALLIWVVVMLGPTILAEDAPHFLRSVGVLPALLIFPALGLSQIWSWTKLPSRLGLALVILLTAASLAMSVNDYFIKYGRDDTTAFWFEAAARDLAEKLNKESGMVLIDQRYFEGWPSVSFLLNKEVEVESFDPQDLKPGQLTPPLTIYSWPHEYREKVAGAVIVPALVSGESGGLAQGDLDPEPYTLFIRDAVSRPDNPPVLANFDNGLQLRDAQTTLIDDRLIEVNLLWSTENFIDQPLVVFVHITKNGDLIGQSDDQPGQGTWPTYLWRPGLIISDQHSIELSEEFDKTQHQVYVGLYDTNTRDRIMVLDAGGRPVSDNWLIQP